MKNLDSPIRNLLKYLSDETRLKSKTIDDYKRCYDLLIEYTSKKKLIYTETVGYEFLHSQMESPTFFGLSEKSRRLVRSIDHLNDFLKSGKVKIFRKMSVDSLSDKSKSILNNYLNFKINECSVKLRGIGIYKTSALYLLKYLETNKISVSEITLKDLYNFISKIESVGRIKCLKNFLTYLQQEGLTNTNYSNLLPALSSREPKKIPHIYTVDEIKKILESIDTSTAIGKRDLALILIAIQTGLRVSDIIDLKKENVDWDNGNIVIRQRKTEVENVIPMLIPTGNAINDYLEYGRPPTVSNFIFVQHKNPTKKITYSIIRNTIHRSIKNSGIVLNDERYGVHSFRYTFISHLFKNGTPLPEISNLLGHTNLQSTMHYLMLDSESLKECILEVPIITEINQKYVIRNILNYKTFQKSLLENRHLEKHNV